MSLIVANSDALLKQGWEAEIWEESQERDVLEALTGVYSETNKMIPDGIINRVMLGESEDKRTIAMVYCSHVRSRLEYCSPLWAGARSP